MACGLALFVGILEIGRNWLGPLREAAPISRSPAVLPLYAAFSLLRITAAYALSLAFALSYGYIAARSRAAERIMLPLLDVLQSIPVLSFLPGVILAMVALFPTRQIGLEIGSILLIFTGQVWNMAFSFHASLKNLPTDLREAAEIYRFGAWQRFAEVELPYGAIGLAWNSMMSVAGGWFFLMVCEMFVLGHRDFRLPGLGSYLQAAASAGDTAAIAWGLAAMIGVIVLLDQLVWRPVLVWAEKFKMEQVAAGPPAHSTVLELLRRSRVVTALRRKVLSPAADRGIRFFARRAEAERAETAGSAAVGAGATKTRWHPELWLFRLLTVAAVGGVSYALFRAGAMLSGLNLQALREIALGAVATFLRVLAALAIGAAWAVPAGVAIGSNPKLARYMQPLAQIAASVPATALFPVVLLVLVRVGGGLGIASIVLILLGTQWYILFNVIAGASALPSDLREVAGIYRFRGVERWRVLILPGIFPYLVTGMVTAAGGAWNASIVAEYFHFKGRILSTPGLGATIAKATDAGAYDVLLAATIVMSAMVVTTNRLLWRRLYTLAETRFRLEA